MHAETKRRPPDRHPGQRQEHQRERRGVYLIPRPVAPWTWRRALPEARVRGALPRGLAEVVLRAARERILGRDALKMALTAASLTGWPSAGGDHLKRRIIGGRKVRFARGAP